MKTFLFGIEVFAKNEKSLRKLKGQRVALLGHQASVDASLKPSDKIVEELAGIYGFRVTALFGPQHGFRGEKQDNMVESGDFTDKSTGLTTFSLYGKTRRLTKQMLDSFDTIIVDLQDVGVRVYTFLTTLCYLLEDLSGYSGKSVIVLDRPNPAGRAMDGLTLETGWESFVGVAEIPMQHGLTLGEFALWFKSNKKLSVNLSVVPMEGYNPDDSIHAWPENRVWIQPSPNMPGLYTVRAYPGTVILEGTTLSEGRGTTRPLSIFGHPNVDWDKVFNWLKEKAPETLKGCHLRQITFQPTFHKHANKPTSGFEIIAEGSFYNPDLFKPFLLIAGVLKAVRYIHPDLELWTKPPYEYEYEKLPVDVITGGKTFRKWVESPSSSIKDLIEKIESDIALWKNEISEHFIYHAGV